MEVISYDLLLRMIHTIIIIIIIIIIITGCLRRYDRCCSVSRVCPRVCLTYYLLESYVR